MDKQKLLKDKSDTIYKDIVDIINQAIINKQTNEQWFIDWLDNLNKLSVSF